MSTQPTSFVCLAAVPSRGLWLPPKRFEQMCVFWLTFIDCSPFFFRIHGDECNWCDWQSQLTGRRLLSSTDEWKWMESFIQFYFYHCFQLQTTKPETQPSLCFAHSVRKSYHLRIVQWLRFIFQDIIIITIFGFVCRKHADVQQQSEWCVIIHMWWDDGNSKSWSTILHALIKIGYTIYM